MDHTALLPVLLPRTHLARRRFGFACCEDIPPPVVTDGVKVTCVEATHDSFIVASYDDDSGSSTIRMYLRQSGQLKCCIEGLSWGCEQGETVISMRTSAAGTALAVATSLHRVVVVSVDRITSENTVRYSVAVLHCMHRAPVTGLCWGFNGVYSSDAAGKLFEFDWLARFDPTEVLDLAEPVLTLTSSFVMPILRQDVILLATPHRVLVYYSDGGSLGALPRMHGVLAAGLDNEGRVLVLADSILHFTAPLAGEELGLELQGAVRVDGMPTGGIAGIGTLGCGLVCVLSGGVATVVDMEREEVMRLWNLSSVVAASFRDDEVFLVLGRGLKRIHVCDTAHSAPPRDYPWALPLSYAGSAVGAAALSIAAVAAASCHRPLRRSRSCKVVRRRQRVPAGYHSLQGRGKRRDVYIGTQPEVMPGDRGSDGEEPPVHLAQLKARIQARIEDDYQRCIVLWRVQCSAHASACGALAAVLAVWPTLAIQARRDEVLVAACAGGVGVVHAALEKAWEAYRRAEARRAAQYVLQGVLQDLEVHIRDIERSRCHAPPPPPPSDPQNPDGVAATPPPRRITFKAIDEEGERLLQQLARPRHPPLPCGMVGAVCAVLAVAALTEPPPRTSPRPRPHTRGQEPKLAAAWEALDSAADLTKQFGDRLKGHEAAILELCGPVVDRQQRELQAFLEKAGPPNGTVEVYENQVRSLWSDWYPDDVPWTDSNGVEALVNPRENPNVLPSSYWVWNGEWRAGSWQYATSFAAGVAWSAEPGMFTLARRKRWRRAWASPSTMQHIDELAAAHRHELHELGSVVEDLLRRRTEPSSPSR